MWLLLTILILTSCGCQTTLSPHEVAPAISVEIMKGSCPSIEAQDDMKVSWTNNDTVDHVLWLEYKDEQGIIIQAGGTDLLQPEATSSTALFTPSEYTYYCSQDRTMFGTILITYDWNAVKQSP